MEQKSENPKKRKTATFLTVALAVVCSIAIWFYAIGYETLEYTKTFAQIPIDILGEDALREDLGYSLLEQPNVTVDVTLAGKRSDINKVRAADITAAIDLSSVVGAGDNRFAVKITAPNGTRVEAQNIDHLVLNVDNYIAKQLTVELNRDTFQYQLGENLYFESITFSPAVITVRGPEKELEKIENAYVDLSLGDVVNSLKATSEIKLYGNNGVIENNYIVADSNVVTAAVSVYEERVIPIKIEFADGVYPSESAIITSTLKDVVFRGSVELMEGIEEYVIQINETQTNFDTALRFPVNAPSGISIVDDEGKLRKTVYTTVTVDFPQSGKKLVKIAPDSDSINFVNLPDGYTALLTEEVEIQLRGLKKHLDSINADLITVQIDLSDAVDGKTVFPVDIILTISEDSTVFVYKEYMISVEVTVESDSTLDEENN